MSRKRKDDNVWLVAISLLPLVCPVHPLQAVAAPGFRPGPNPTHTPELPNVFSIRVTDVFRLPPALDPEQDAFLIGFEILNWTNTRVGAIHLFVNSGSGVGGSDAPPRFSADGGCGLAFVDEDGRPIFIGSDNANFPGGPSWVAIDNDWQLTDCTPEKIAFCGGTPLKNRDLVGALNSGGSAAACALVPGCQIDAFGRPVIPDMETIDDTTLPDLNVLDGFVIHVDDLDPGEFFSFTIYFVDTERNLVGTPAGGNEFGFATANIFRGVAGPPIARRLPSPGLFGAPQNDPRGSNNGTSSTSGLMFLGVIDNPLQAEEGAAMNLPSVGNDALAPINGAQEGYTNGTIQLEACHLTLVCNGECTWRLDCADN